MKKEIKILLTEDKKINQDIILGIFEESKFKIEVANYGKGGSRLGLKKDGLTSFRFLMGLLGLLALLLELGMEGLPRGGLGLIKLKDFSQIGGHLTFKLGCPNTN